MRAKLWTLPALAPSYSRIRSLPALWARINMLVVGKEVVFAAFFFFFFSLFFWKLHA